MLTSEDLVSQRYTDHHLVMQTAQTTLGSVQVFALNLLTRQCVVFYKSPLSKEKLVRLNLPLPWFLTHPKYASAQLQLQQYDRILELMIEPNASRKQQLTLARLNQNTQENLPLPLENIFLETEAEYGLRLRKLAEFIAQKMLATKTNGYLPIFLLQEVPTQAEALRVFLACLQECDSNIANYYVQISSKPFMPVILYDKTRLFLQKDAQTLALVNAASEHFIEIIKASSESSYIGQFALAAFNSHATREQILINSAHIDFGMINQTTHHNTLHLMQQLAQLVQQHKMILGGDFNRKIASQTLQQLSHFSFPGCVTAFKSTEPGLQLHDTLDGIFIPELPALYSAAH